MFLTVLHILNLIVTIDAVRLGLNGGFSRAFFRPYTGALVMFWASTILMGGHTISNEWERHLLFFAGQFLMFLAIRVLIRGSQGPQAADEPGAQPSTATNMGFMAFVTNQGLQHFLAVPIFFITTAFLNAEIATTSNVRIRMAARLFYYGLFSLTMIHLSEFIVESQKLIPFLDGDLIELIEMLWFLLGIGIINSAVRILSRKSV